MNADDLRAFERGIAADFDAKRIRAPIHLYSGNEEQMIDVFSDVAAEDWVCCSWRSHYQCLLRGVPAEELRERILAGDSIALCFPEYRIVSSAIVGGILPIALGLAMGCRGTGVRVNCFMGEMTAETGIAHEAMKYASRFGLPIRWIIEDNGLSVCTDTWRAWNGQTCWVGNPDVHYYRYQSEFPHAGSGHRIQF